MQLYDRHFRTLSLPPSPSLSHTYTHRLIRLSSPKLNIITVFGVIILYVSMVLFVIPTHSKSVIHGLCIARLWFLALGASLAFGTIIMKMFRVYIIFSNPTPKRKKVSQRFL